MEQWQRFRKALKAQCQVGLGAVTLVGAILLSIGSHPPPLKANGRLALRRHIPARIHRKRNEAETESYNWSGYAVSGADGSVTDVKASWVVPSVDSTCASVPEGYAAFWAGIDGWSSSTVEQIGTDSDCVNLEGTKTGTPTYYAWFEFYPQDSFLIGTYNDTGLCETDCVAPGDIISAQVKFNASASHGPHSRTAGNFSVTIVDETKGWSFTTTSTVPGAKESSAELIAEAPSGCDTASGFCDLSDFGIADYGEEFAPISNTVTASATIGSVTQALGSFANVEQAIMVDYPSGGSTMAQPAPLQDKGTSFPEDWVSAGP
jgi:Peptidase A4 family